MSKILVGIAFALSSTIAGAQEVSIGGNGTTESVLNSQKGKRTTVRLKSGAELTGTVREVNARLMVLASPQGREFFDAVIALDSVEAVLIRTKQ